MIQSDYYARELDALAAEGLRRTLQTCPATGGKFTVDGRVVLNFSSNDYLNLANDPRLRAAAKQAVDQYGCGAGASRLMSGHLPLHDELERRLAELVGCEAALVFGSGFLANLGVITALAGRGDTLFADRLNHASLIDGCRLSGAELVRYRHNDARHLQTLLDRCLPAGRRIIITDSIFSMDGDQAPLAELADLARRHDALLIVDDAHAIGVLGPNGGGACRALAPSARPDVIVGTLSKSLGSYGGFVAGSAELREYLINCARSFIYSTAVAPACLASAIAALDVLAASPGLGTELLECSARFRGLLERTGLRLGPSDCQIVPVMIGDNEKALALSEALAEQDILAVAVRPPTVPGGTARIRLSVTLAHEPADLARTADAIARAAEKVAVP